MTAEVPPLIEILAEIRDTRQEQGKRHPLAGMLTLACVGILCGYQGPSAIAEWGRNYGVEYAAVFGFEQHGYPSTATWYRVLGGVDIQQVETVLTGWCERVLVAMRGSEQELTGVSVDGKTLRGSKRQGADNSHLLSAYVHQIGVVLAQTAVDDATNELGAIEPFLLSMALEGRVVTADALFTQQKVVQCILDQQGHYVLPVKENQELTYAAIAEWFEAPAPYDLPNAIAQQVEKRHGRVTRWRLEATTALNDYLEWPGLQQVFCITCTVFFPKPAQTHTHVRYGITSLSPHQAPPNALLTFSREHWGIENRLHWVRDVTLAEDRSLVHVGHTHQVMAALRNLALSLLRLSGYTAVASTLRLFAAQPDKAVSLVLKPLPIAE
jgi:predicted transposase YbfD/YdcC